MKIFWRIILIVLGLLFFGYVTYCQTIPEYKGYVSDYENLFTPDQNAQLTKLLTDYESETSIEIAVLTVKDFESDIADFSQKTAEKWGVGKKDVNNGLLIVISKNRKVLRAVTGYGLEGYLPDGWLKITGDSIATKYPGKYYEGTIEFINKCQTRIGKEYSLDTNKELIKKTEKKEKKDESIISRLLTNMPWWGWIIIVGIWIIIFLIDPELAIQLLFLGMMKGGSSGSSKGFGGGSFGGGGSSSKW